VDDQAEHRQVKGDDGGGPPRAEAGKAVLHDQRGLHQPAQRNRIAPPHASPAPDSVRRMDTSHKLPPTDVEESTPNPACTRSRSSRCLTRCSPTLSSRALSMTSAAITSPRSAISF